MNPLESIRQKLSTEATWEARGGVQWLATADFDLLRLATVMNEAEARFVTITAYELATDEGFRLEYHWDLNGQLLGFSFAAPEKSIASIFALCPATDWIEREIHEEYGIDFTGRAYEPLLLKPGAALGVNLREEVTK